MHTRQIGSTPAASDEGAFTADELALLREFYAGVRARVLSGRYGTDPWQVVRRHRLLPPDQYAAIAARLDLAGARQ